MEHIETPEAVLQVSNEGQPGWTPGILFRSVVTGENPSNHVFVDGDAESQGNLLSMRGQPQVGSRCFIGTTASRSSWLGPLGPGLSLRWDEKSRRYFRFLKAWWRLKRVEGLRTMAERIRRAGRMRRAHKPATRRSEVRRFGDRCRERLRIKSCCLTRTDSATTERMPPGPQSRARVAMA